MSQLLFVWLGSNRAKRQGVSAPGVLLDRAAGAGLPVPAGAILLDDVYRLALAEEIAVIRDGRVRVPDIHLLYELLYQAIRFPPIHAPVAVRPALSVTTEAGATQLRPAGLKVFVDFADPGQLADSLSEAWSSALGRPDDGRHDVLVMEMVTAEVTGVALSKQDNAEDLVYFSRKSAVPAPATATESLSLPRPRWWWQSSQGIPPFAQRLQKLLRGVRRTFAKGDWRVEWIDDGHVCWLCQIHLWP